MLHYSIIVSLLIIPLIRSSDTTTTTKVITSTIKPSFYNKTKNGTSNTTLNNGHRHEGGLIPDTLVSSEYHIPLNLDTKSGTNRVKPRKGVVYNNTEDLANVPIQPNMTINTNNKFYATTITPDLHNNGSSKKYVTDVKLKTKMENETKQLKPSVLSYDSLVNVFSESDNYMPDTKTSNSFGYNQMSPPNPNEEEPTIRIRYMNMSVHKYMIMPIVITMLAIPMFAALGYLALKRGKEAWKNRHYKRMDFLLDGMYND